MDQDDTFRVLKRTPFDELQQFLDALPKSPPIYNFGSVVFETKKHQLVRHYEMIRCLEEQGWTFREFVLESEKRSIITAIDTYNKESAFPMELVERAKEFFPNARFTQARIDLE
jgi:hypothetical protein